MITATDGRPSPAQTRWAHRRLRRWLHVMLPVFVVLQGTRTGLHVTGRGWLDWLSPGALLLLGQLVWVVRTTPPGRRRTAFLSVMGASALTFWVTDVRLGRLAWGTTDALIVPGLTLCLALCVAGIVVLWPARREWNDHFTRREIDKARARGLTVPV